MVAGATPQSSYSASGGLWYLGDGAAHDGVDGKPRNWFTSGLDCMPETADAEWKAVRQQFGKDGTRAVADKPGEVEGAHVQAVHVVLSYDKSEYDPNDPEAVARAHEQSVETAKKLRKGHQVVVATQTDGKSGLAHSHLYFNAVHPETGRSMNGRHPAKDIQQLHRIINEVAATRGFDNETLMNERAQSAKLNSAERRAKDGGAYVWKDDLAARLGAALSQSTTRDEWKAHAADAGVTVAFRGKGASFAFTDADGTERHIRAAGLGTRWRGKHIDAALDTNRSRAAVRAAEAAPLPIEPTAPGLFIGSTEATPKRVVRVVRKKEPERSDSNVTRDDSYSKARAQEHENAAFMEALRGLRTGRSIRDKKSGMTRPESLWDRAHRRAGERWEADKTLDSAAALTATLDARLTDGTTMRSRGMAAAKAKHPNGLPRATQGEQTAKAMERLRKFDAQIKGANRQSAEHSRGYGIGD